MNKPDEDADVVYEVQVLSPGVVGQTNVLDADDGGFYISCCGGILPVPVPPDEITLAKAFALVSLKKDEEWVKYPYDQPITLGIDQEEKYRAVVAPPRHFRFFGSEHPASDGFITRLPKLIDSPNNESVQYLYVWAKLSTGDWAKPALIKMSLLIAGETDSGDKKP